MEKYIVIVNRKYLVSVEAGSRGGAEHRCLDLIYGIETAQAFSRADLRTEFFRDNAIECDTISFAELVTKSEAYKAAVEYENEAIKAIEDNRSRIENLRREIALLEDNSALLKLNIDESVSERHTIL